MKLKEQVKRIFEPKCNADGCKCLATVEINNQFGWCLHCAVGVVSTLQKKGIETLARKASGGFVTIEGKPVFIGGPGQGGGGTGGGGGGGATLEERAKANRLGLSEDEVGFANVPSEQFVESRVGNLPKEYEPFVTPYSSGELDEMGARCFLSESGKSGFAIKPDGDIISVFSSPEVKEGKWGIASAIANGGTKLDCFGGFLSDKFYPSFGFGEYDRWTWDDQYSPPGWNYGKYNRPDVVLMRLGG